MTNTEYCLKEIETLREEIKQLKKELKTAKDDGTIDEILDMIYENEIRIGDLEGFIAEINYIDNGIVF